MSLMANGDVIEKMDPSEWGTLCLKFFAAAGSLAEVLSRHDIKSKCIDLELKRLDSEKYEVHTKGEVALKAIEAQKQMLLKRLEDENRKREDARKKFKDKCKMIDKLVARLTANHKNNMTLQKRWFKESERIMDTILESVRKGKVKCKDIEPLLKRWDTLQSYIMCSARDDNMAVMNLPNSVKQLSAETRNDRIDLPAPRSMGLLSNKGSN